MNNVGILSTPDGTGARFELDTDESIRWHGVWKNYIQFPSGLIYWNDQSNSKQICMYANNDIYNTEEAYTSNAGIALNSSQHPLNPGRFTLVARDTTTRCELIGEPSKNLTWCNKFIDTIYSSDDNYIQYTNGLLLQWGICEVPSIGGVKVTLSIPYTNDSYVVQVSNRNYLIYQAPGLNAKSSTSFDIDYQSTESVGSVHWFTIGRWK